MKKIYLHLSMLAMALTATATPKVTVTPLGDDYQPDAAPKTQKVATTADVLINEDFNLMTAGTPDAPDFEHRLASEYDDVRIPTELTHGNQWIGHKVFSAGGAIALQTINPQDAAYLETPIGDYSGSVTVSLKAKYLLTEWEEGDGKLRWTGSGIQIGIANRRGNEFQTSEGDVKNAYPWFGDVRLYANQGWCEITVEFDNYSAYNDAYILLYCLDGILLDDVKVTSSIDKFIAAPVISGITNVTETSFTVQFEPVYKAYNYYTYLLAQTGYDENGEPIYDITYPKEYMDTLLTQLEAMGITWEEYKEMAEISIDNPYSNIGMVDRRDPKEYTFEGLEPDKDYYFAVRSHNVHTFSDMNILPANVLAKPVAKEAADIQDNSFKAQWEAVTKAETHQVDLYGVNEVKEDEPEFIIFEEDFDNVTAYTDSKDINNPQWAGVDEGISLDDLTSTPGWSSSEDSFPLVEGKLGTKWAGAWLRSPNMYVAGADKVRIALKVEADSDQPVYLRFADVTYEIPIVNGIYEDEVELPTNGLKETWMRFACTDDYTMFVDYVNVTQSLHKGDRTFTWLGATNAEERDSHSFMDLDPERYDMYAYSVTAIRGEGKQQIKSEPSERMLVDMSNKKSFLRVDDVVAPDVVEVARYTIDGTLIKNPQRGINIVKYSDGSVKKVIVTQ